MIRGSDRPAVGTRRRHFANNAMRAVTNAWVFGMSASSSVSHFAESLLQESPSLSLVAGLSALADLYDSAVDGTPIRDVPEREILPVLPLPPEDPPVTAHGARPSSNSLCFQCVCASWHPLGVVPFHYSSGSAHPAPESRFREAQEAPREPNGREFGGMVVDPGHFDRE